MTTSPKPRRHLLTPFRLITPLLLLILIVTLAPATASADGVIIPWPPICLSCPVPPPPPREVPYLTVESHRVNVTIDQQVATTRVDQVFRNDSEWSLEGTYIFPLPEEAAIGEFSMWIEGEKVEGQLYTKEEARRIYNEIVRRRLDPALLEYVGRDLFQASIFPIDPGDSRRVVIEYSQILPVDNGLVQYVYPLSTEKFSAKPLEDVSVSVEIKSNEQIKAVYSPSHPVSINRNSDFNAVVGWEDRNALPDTDFALYYTLSPEELGLNLLSYQDNDEDGFFTMLIAPSIEVAEVIEKDVILVLDTSGSMEGEKLQQAQDALSFVLDNLNEGDRFNIVSFSTGTRSFSNRLEPLSALPEAQRFVQDLRAEGSTDINRALLEALDSIDNSQEERPAIIIFLTDGLPTSGTTEPNLILNNVEQAAASNVRIFPFGVGDDVDTFLLDLLARQERGASAYVRPGARVDEAVSGFYAKVSTPVLADVSLTVDGVRIEDTYPFPLPDIFAGTQLVVTGRYRQGGPATATLEGTVNGRPIVFRYDDLTFRNSGGQDFIPRLWATRKIGFLLNDIRLNGENREAVDQIVQLSIRYGIITPYTSFLVEEPDDALTEAGRQRIAQEEAESMSFDAAPSSGAEAVEKSVASEALQGADMAAPAPQFNLTDEDQSDVSAAPIVKTIRDKAFVLRDGIWTDTQFDPDQMTTTRFNFASEELLAFLAAQPEAAPFFALGEQVIVVVDGVAYETLPADLEALSETETTANQLAAQAQQSNPPAQDQQSGNAAPVMGELLLTADAVRGQAPLQVTLQGRLVGGDDDNPDLYCVEHTFSFGDGVSERVSPECVPLSDDFVVQRDYSTSYVYEEPGTYYAQFILANERTEFLEITVEEPSADDKVAINDATTSDVIPDNQVNHWGVTLAIVVLITGLLVLCGGLLWYFIRASKAAQKKH